jgi:hypothetical protein
MCGCGSAQASAARHHWSGSTRSLRCSLRVAAKSGAGVLQHAAPGVWRHSDLAAAALLASQELEGHLSLLVNRCSGPHLYASLLKSAKRALLKELQAEGGEGSGWWEAHAHWEQHSQAGSFMFAWQGPPLWRPPEGRALRQPQRPHPLPGIQPFHIPPLATFFYRQHQNTHLSDFGCRRLAHALDRGQLLGGLQTGKETGRTRPTSGGAGWRRGLKAAP